MTKGKMETSPYKGVRDFYPEDMFLENYLFDKMRSMAQSFGYLEYGASILEPSELYRAKSGEEIVNEQTYNFTDRGGREVTLRPEMTPTIARMIAARRREMALPLRWYSIPNLFRYERPQYGRLREHFQLNVDIFGESSQEADIEIIKMAHSLLLSFGAEEKDFEIRINNRQITNALFEKFEVKEEDRYKISKVLDKRDKISDEGFKEALEIVLGEKTQDFIDTLNSNKKLVEMLGEDSVEISGLTKLIDALLTEKIKNVTFDQYLVRGFDYYTGFIFEIFDTDPENNRSLFGGGRYDDLLQIFGVEKLPAVGFGAGDVTIIKFLEKHNLLPEYKSPIDLYICKIDDSVGDSFQALCGKLRKDGINLSSDFSGRKIAERLKSAVKQKIPFFLCVGEKELKEKKYSIKRLSNGRETLLEEDNIASFLKQRDL